MLSTGRAQISFYGNEWFSGEIYANIEPEELEATVDILFEALASTDFLGQLFEDVGMSRDQEIHNLRIEVESSTRQHAASTWHLFKPRDRDVRSQKRR